MAPRATSRSSASGTFHARPTLCSSTTATAHGDPALRWRIGLPSRAVGWFCSPIAAAQRTGDADAGASVALPNSVMVVTRGLFDRISGRIAAPTGVTAGIADTRHDALSDSAAADRHVAPRVGKEAAGWYSTVPLGCPGGTMPFASEHAAAVAESDRGNVARRFTHLDNPLARRSRFRTRQASAI